jgi:hypothetical protein
MMASVSSIADGAKAAEIAMKGRKLPNWLF